MRPPVLPWLSLAATAAMLVGCESHDGRTVPSSDSYAQETSPPPVTVHTAVSRGADGAPLSLADAHYLLQARAAVLGFEPNPPNKLEDLVAQFRSDVGYALPDGQFAEVGLALGDALIAGADLEQSLATPSERDRAIVIVVRGEASGEIANAMSAFSGFAEPVGFAMAPKAASGSAAALLARATQGETYQYRLEVAPVPDLASSVSRALFANHRLIAIHTPAPGDARSTIWMRRGKRIKALHGKLNDLLGELRDHRWQRFEITSAHFAGDAEATALLEKVSGRDRHTFSIASGTASEVAAAIDRASEQDQVAHALSYGGDKNSMTWLRKTFTAGASNSESPGFTVYRPLEVEAHPEQLAEKAAALTAQGWQPEQIYYRGAGTVAWMKCDDLFVPVVDDDVEEDINIRSERFAQSLANYFQRGCKLHQLIHRDRGALAIMLHQPFVPEQGGQR